MNNARQKQAVLTAVATILIFMVMVVFLALFGETNP